MARFQYFDNGSQNYGDKRLDYGVRCVRKSEHLIELTLDSINHATTNGTCDGAISISVAGGSGSYSYNWNNSDTIEDVNNLCPGLYKVTVSDDITADTVVDSMRVINLKPYGILSGDTIWTHPLDNGKKIEWGSFGIDIAEGNGAESDTNGYANTNAIVSQIGAGDYAAYICDTLNAYGYDDWYLPSRSELNALYIDSALIGNFISNKYWASTESLSDDQMARFQYFDNGSQNYGDKRLDYGVRCVRKSEHLIELTLDSINHATTNGTCDGAISISVAGGSGSYSYNWNNSDTIEDVNNLCPGLYKVTVSDDITADTVVDSMRVINLKPYGILSGDTIWVHPIDNSDDIEWGGYGTDITSGNGAESDTNGYANTKAIVAEMDSGAAYLCDTLNAMGYSDWYLPSKVELDTLYENKDTIGSFYERNYWSSTGSNNNLAWNQVFDNGFQYEDDKYGHTGFHI